MNRLNRAARWPWLVAVLSTLLAIAGEAREFRTFIRVPTPADVPLEGRAVDAIRPVPRALVEQAVNTLADAWNGSELAPLLADELPDRSRLFDVLAEVVPRDARLTVLGLEGVSTLAQSVTDDAQGRTMLVSTVSAIVRTQVEFTDPLTGFSRLEGRNEFYFRVEQRLQGRPRAPRE